MINTHTTEFDMLLNDTENPLLRGLLLNEDIKTYENEKQLKSALKMILINFYTKKIESIK